MNRRALLQALGLAPLAVLVPESADVGNNPKAGSWNERRLFSVQVQVKPGEITWRDKECPIFSRLVRLVNAVTITPDISQKAELRLYDRDQRPWVPYHPATGRAIALAGPQDKVTPAREELLLDVASLFRRGASVLRQAVLLRARGALAADVARELGPDEPMYPTLTNRIQAGALDQKLNSLAEIRLQFFYFGPPPYAPGKIHTFDYTTETFVPRA